MNEKITVTNIEKEVKKVSWEVEEILEPKFKKSYIQRSILPSVTYRTYIFWILEKLREAWFDLEWREYSDVPREHWEDIFNILWDRSLTTFFMVWKSLWMLDFSTNDINQFEEENELKVLQVSYSEVGHSLREWRKTDPTLKVTEHRSATVEDDYFDDTDLSFDRNEEWEWKRSLRIRTKIYDDESDDEHFYTIKRKITSREARWVETRKCLEKEFWIEQYWNFHNFLSWIWLRNSRSKKKHRRSFTIFYYDKGLEKEVKAKLDIDMYESIPEFLEIECDDNKAIANIIRIMWLEDKEQLSTWSRWLFRKYNIYDQYDTKYTVSSTWRVKWTNGDIWNINNEWL